MYRDTKKLQFVHSFMLLRGYDVRIVNEVENSFMVPVLFLYYSYDTNHELGTFEIMWAILNFLFFP